MASLRPTRFSKDNKRRDTNRRVPAVWAPLTLLSAVVAGGTAGYMLIEGWGIWDAFYMTVTTVATVGFREINPLSRAGQGCTVLLVVVGVGTALFAFSAITAFILEGGWRQYLADRSHTR